MESKIIEAYNGIEVVDSTPEALERLSVMEYLEERQLRQTERERRKRAELLKNPLYKLAVTCGIMTL